jgi:hypothetical protein
MTDYRPITPPPRPVETVISVRSDQLRVICRKCGHPWALAFLPIDITKMVTLIRHAKCPNCCAGPKEISIDFGVKVEPDRIEAVKAHIKGLRATKHGLE